MREPGPTAALKDWSGEQRNFFPCILKVPVWVQYLKISSPAHPPVKQSIKNEMYSSV